MLNDTLTKTMTTSEPCTASGEAIKAAIGVASVLLAASELLSLTKRWPASGLIHGLLLALKGLQPAEKEQAQEPGNIMSKIMTSLKTMFAKS